VIDGHDISQFGLHHLRKKLTVIAQVCLHASLPAAISLLSQLCLLFVYVVSLMLLDGTEGHKITCLPSNMAVYNLKWSLKFARYLLLLSVSAFILLD